MPKNLFLVRHGESIGNAARRNYEREADEEAFSKIMDSHESQYYLTEEGIEQAKKAGVWLKDNGFVDFYRMLVSSNVRTLQTAAFLDLPNAQWSEDFNLRERDSGLFDTLLPSEKKVSYHVEQKFEHLQPFYYRPPQGESVADVCQRIKLVLDTLARECDGQNVIIVCHGHIMRSFKIVLERMTVEKANDFLSTQEDYGRVPNCSILHYTRDNPYVPQDISTRFDWVRMIRPAGGGKELDDFSEIIRKKSSNEELLLRAENLIKNLTKV